MELFGWIASAMLLVTIVIQIAKQWRDHTSRGVSVWLYLGQLVASVGFLVYSASVGNVVFVVTNTLMLGANILGLFIMARHRRRAR